MLGDLKPKGPKGHFSPRWSVPGRFSARFSPAGAGGIGSPVLAVGQCAEGSNDRAPPGRLGRTRERSERGRYGPPPPPTFLRRRLASPHLEATFSPADDKARPQARSMEKEAADIGGAQQGPKLRGPCVRPVPVHSHYPVASVQEPTWQGPGGVKAEGG